MKQPSFINTNPTPATLLPRARLIMLVLLSIVSLQLSSFAQGTAFTYQGRFTDNGAPYTGNVEIQATLWDAVSGGGQSAANVPAQVVVAVTNGLFVLPLNFGANFPGANRWLQLEVRTTFGAFTTLTPRQPLTPAPYAITAGNLTGPLPAAQLSGTVASANLAGTYSSAFTLSNAANSFSGSGAGLTALDAGQLTSGAVPDARLGANMARTNQVWLLGGNTGAAPGANFLGTTDNQSLELRVNGARAFRLEPNGTSPNVIGGYVNNSVSPGIFGATIAGGGRDGFVHTISAHHGTIGGGDRNTVSGEDGTIAGGGGNFVAGNYASIGGGLFNINLGFVSTIAGGRSNTIQFNVAAATIGGGQGNSIQPNTSYATIPGGYLNSATSYAFAAGHRAKANHQGSLVWADSQDADFASTGNNQFCVRASGGVWLSDSTPSISFGTTTRQMLDFYGLGFGMGVQTGTLYARSNTRFSWFKDGSHSDFENNPGGGTVLMTLTADGLTVNSNVTAPSVSFGSTLSQKLNLYSTNFGIGIQNSVQYSRVGVGGGFGWYAGGAHNDNTFNPGGGTTLMTLTGGGLVVNGLFVHASDRNLKENFAPVQPREMLAKVLALPLSSWNLKADPAIRHIGPMAQDFYAAFNLGADDKHIATVDADGVALAAIQGLNQKLTEELKRRDAENAAAKEQNRLLGERLERLEKLLPRN